MCTVPLVLTNQIQACTPAPNILCWYLLFPWYWPFKFKHAYTHQKLYVNVFCSLGTDNVDVYCSFGAILWEFKHAFILMHYYVTTKVTAHQHHNKNQLTLLGYYFQHGHVVKEPYKVTSYQEGWILLLPMWLWWFWIKPKISLCSCSSLLV